MSDTLADPPPIACTLGAEDFQARLAWIAELNASALRASRRDGLKLHLTYAPEALDRVRDLVAREQGCCAFLAFEVEATPQAVRLTITSPEAAREGLDVILAPFTSAPAAASRCGCCGGAAA